jgi:hypothetical protein
MKALGGIGHGFVAFDFGVREGLAPETVTFDTFGDFCYGNQVNSDTDNHYPSIFHHGETESRRKY